MRSNLIRTVFAFSFAMFSHACFAQSPDMQNIEKELSTLRSMADSDRARATADLAMRIRNLPGDPNRLNLALALANLSTEGDFGRSTLQLVTDTLVLAASTPGNQEVLPFAFQELAELSIFEGMTVHVDNPEYKAAYAKVKAISDERARANFTLEDLTGKKWTLRALKGKVVWVNFWATWCPPCRKEMPDMEELYRRYKSKGFVVLAISDEDLAKVSGFVGKNGYDFTVLLDPGDKVTKQYSVDGIPKSVLYDRNGKMVAQAMDMRTKSQMMAMLAKAGLK
jgi:thiol-disulfide isomerase/thioredoxin